MPSHFFKIYCHLRPTPSKYPLEIIKLPSIITLWDFKSRIETEVLIWKTKNQETLDRILKFVNKYYQEHHSSPTINDVAEGVGVARSTTHRYLQELSDRNLIDYSRGILSAPQSAKMKTAYVSAPLVGSIRCGNPEDEEESIEEYVSLPVSMFGKGDFYILRAKAIPWWMPESRG